MPFLEDFSNNLAITSFPVPVGKNVKRTKASLKDVNAFLHHLKLIIPYFCQHPHSIIEEIEDLKEKD